MLGRNKNAWVASGPALSEFKTKIMPCIGPILRTVDIGEVEIYMRVYVIGKTRQTTRPMIAVICADPNFGRNAKKSLVNSPLPKSYPNFDFGWFKLFLGHPTPFRPLACKVEQHVGEDDAFEFRKDPTVLSTSTAPTVGRPLVVSSSMSRFATSGITVSTRRSNQYFQLTVGHVFDPENLEDHLRFIATDSNACSFDGKNEGKDEGPDVSDDVDALSFASQSFCEGEEDLSYEDSIFSTPSIHKSFNSQRSRNLNRQKRKVEPLLSDLVEVGNLALQSKDGDYTYLDYAMIAIPRPADEKIVNRVIFPGAIFQPRPFTFTRSGRRISRKAPPSLQSHRLVA